MDECLIERFYKLLPDNHETDIREIMLAVSNITFLQVFECAIENYDTMTPTMHLTNLNVMIDLWYTNTRMTKLWQHPKTYTNYGLCVAHPVAKEYIVDAVLVVFNARKCT